MRILLDTHIALWAVADSGRLSEEVTRMLEAEKNEIYYSVASVWEIAIKHHIKPEQMPIPEEEFVELCDETPASGDKAYIYGKDISKVGRCAEAQ